MGQTERGEKKEEQMFTDIDLQQMLEDAVITVNNLIDISTDSVSKSHQIHNKDMVAEKMSTEVAEARPRCSCTSSPICHSCRTRSVNLR